MQSFNIPSSLILCKSLTNQKKHPPTKMDYHHTIDISIYKGHENHKHHLFICETIWDVFYATTK